MLLSMLLACGDPVQEYTIPIDEKSDWKKWEKQGQKGPPIGEARGAPPADGTSPPPVNPGGSPPDPVNDVQIGVASCRPIASSEPLAPRTGGVHIIGEIERSSQQTGPLLLEFVQEKEQSTSIYSVACGGGSSFDVVVPEGLGEGYLVVFIDVDGNGPSEQDESGISEPIIIRNEQVEVGLLTLNGSIAPLSLPFVLQPPNIDGEQFEQTGDLPTDTTDLPPPQTGERDQSAKGDPDSRSPVGTEGEEESSEE